MEEQYRSYWGVIPGEVMHDRELPHAGKLLYLVLSSMAHKNGYCWPANETLAAELDLSKRRVRELLAMLQERGYIRVHVRRTEETNEVERRYIYCGMFPDRETPPPSGEDLPDPPAEDFLPSGEKSPDPPAKSRTCIKCKKSKEENIPPIIPQGESQMLFDRFWQAYPKKKAKQDAMKAWAKLAPDMALCREMSAALKWQKQSEQWTRDGGQYIPHPGKWLRQRLWEDEPDGPDGAADEPGGEEGVTYI